MVKQHVPEPPPVPPSAAKSAVASSTSADIARLIGERLRTMFDNVLTEPVPEKFRCLLEELERASSRAPAGDVSAPDPATKPTASPG
jgi:hypothetical protein